MSQEKSSAGHEKETTSPAQESNTVPFHDDKVYAPPGREPQTTFDPNISFEQIRNRMHHFVDKRDWHKFHSPRNLVLALTGEVGELAEIFQWRGEVEVGLPTFTPEEKVHVGEELADCVLYLTRIAQQCGIDLPSAIVDKMEKNAKKYPADRFKGSSAKYNSDDLQFGEERKTQTKITYMIENNEQ